MAENIIKVENLTKDYKQGRGVFNLDFQVKQGECFGYVGTNGSGKTTTIRNIMGFIRPDRSYIHGRVVGAFQAGSVDERSLYRPDKQRKEAG